MSVEERVYVVDDDEAMRDSLVWLLESHGLSVELYASPAAFLAAYREDMIGCLVLDVRMPGMTGLELYDRLRARDLLLPVIFVTGHGNVPMAVSALKSGAVDFIEKPFSDQRMIRVIEECLTTGRAQRELRRRAVEVGRRFATLTDREREVMEQIVAGKPNREIAGDLGISARTVEIHRGRVMEKMGADSLAELVRASELLRSGAKAPTRPR